MSIKNCEWIGVTNYENKAQFLLKDSWDAELEVTYSQFDCGVSYDSSTIMSFELNQSLKKSSLIKITLGTQNGVTENVHKNLFSFNTFTNCNNAFQGSIYNLQNGAKLSDFQSSYQQNSALYGGIAFLSGPYSSLTLDSPLNLQHNRAYYGAIIYQQNGCSAYLKNSQILNNQAYEGTLIYQTDRSFFHLSTNIKIHYNQIHKRALVMSLSQSYFIIMNATVSINTASYDSVFIYSSNTKEQYHLVDGKDIFSSEQNYLFNYLFSSTITLNEVTLGGKSISVYDGALQIIDCEFQGNYIYSETKGVYVSQGLLYIIGSKFYQSEVSSRYKQIKSKLIADITGGFVSVGLNSTLYVISNEFVGGRGDNGGCIGIQGARDVYIGKSNFSLCAAYLGGAIYGNNYQNLVIQECQFKSNVVYSGYSQNLYSVSGQGNLTVWDSYFWSYHNSIYMDSIVEVNMKNVQFMYEELVISEIPEREYAGALFMKDIQKLKMSGSNLFKNLTAINGGAISLELSINLKLAYGPLLHTLEGLTIEECTATKDGGAIYLQNIDTLLLSNSYIRNNQALNEGGAIQFICVENSQYACNLQLISTVIEYNSAKIGGGIKWNFKKPTLSQGSSVTLNQCLVYGNNFASFPQGIAILDDEDQYLEYFERRNREPLEVSEPLTKYRYDNVQSGGFIPTKYFAIIDDQKQVVTTSSGSMMEFMVLGSQLNRQIQTQIQGVSKFFSTFGVYNISGVIIIAQPDSQQELVLRSLDAIPVDKPRNQQYLQQAFNSSKTVEEYQIQIELNLRSCLIGEGLTLQGACYECPSNTYLLVAPIVPNTSCKVCPIQKAICNGKNNIGPQPGYWRKDNETDYFIECPSKENCLGLLNGNPVGECADGYYGALCTSCMPGYQRQGDYDCSKCPSNIVILFKMFGILVAILLVILLLQRQTLDSSTNKTTHSVYIKIFLNHLHMIFISAQFKLGWPENLQTFFSLSAPITEASNSIVSLDCWMDNRLFESVEKYKFTIDEDDFRVIHQKLLSIAAFPIIVGMILVGVWILILKRKKQMEYLEIKFTSTIIIILYLIHPSITQTMINMFDCQDYDGDLRMMGDLQLICYTGQHLKMTLYVALPCLLIWGIGIPASICFLMFREKERLDTIATKQKFGFMFNGYKRQNYFWEIIIMYRKILCIFIAIFMNRIGSVIQALVILIILVFFMQINNLRRPFISRNLNDIEGMSLLTQIITIYCGIFFISSKDSTLEGFNPNKDFELNYMGKTIFIVIIILAHGLFTLFWFLKFVTVIRYLLKEKNAKLYIFLFLCCRQDKLAKENTKLAQEAKRETIIEKIEEVQFFMKGMKSMYTSQIFYEGHDRFMKMLYYIEKEKKYINLKEKKHNFYIQGKMARDRKFDQDRMKEIMDPRMLSLDTEFGCNTQNKQAKDPKLSKRKSHFFHQSSILGQLKSIKRQLNQNSSGIDKDISGTPSEEKMLPIEFFSQQKLLMDKSKNHASHVRPFDELTNNNQSNLNDISEDLSSRPFILKPQPKKLSHMQSDGNLIIEKIGSKKTGSQKRRAKKNPPLEDRLKRSRNAHVKLTKEKKSRVFASEIPSEVENDQEDEVEQVDEVTPVVHDNFFKDGFGFITERSGEREVEKDDIETLQKLREMRGLTKRLEQQNKKREKQKMNIFQRPQKFENDVKNNQIKNQLRQIININRSPKMNNSFSSFTQTNRNSSIMDFEKFKKSNMLSIKEAIEYANQGKDMKQKVVEGKEALRGPNHLRREIILGNFCEVREFKEKKRLSGGGGPAGSVGSFTRIQTKLKLEEEKNQMLSIDFDDDFQSNYFHRKRSRRRKKAFQKLKKQKTIRGFEISSSSSGRGGSDSEDSKIDYINQGIEELKMEEKKQERNSWINRKEESEISQEVEFIDENKIRKNLVDGMKNRRKQNLQLNSSVQAFQEQQIDKSSLVFQSISDKSE